MNSPGNKVVFSTACLPEGDILPQPWIGVYNINWGSDLNTNCVNTNCLGMPKFKFLIAGSGRNFVWSQDDKTITYEADLGLSGMTETRTIDSGTGEILERKNKAMIISDISNWKIYRNEKYGYEIRYPENFYFSGFSEARDGNYIGISSFPPGGGTIAPAEINISYMTENFQELFIGSQENYEDSCIKINVKGFDGIRCADAERPSDTYTDYLPFKNGIIKFNIGKTENNVGENKVTDFSNIIDQILSTFKFTEKDEKL